MAKVVKDLVILGCREERKDGNFGKKLKREAKKEASGQKNVNLR